MTQPEHQPVEWAPGQIPGQYAPSARPRRAPSGWSKLRIGQKIALVGLSVALLGVALGIVGAVFGSHDSKQDTAYLHVARQVMVGKTDSSRIDAGHTICDSLAGGIPESTIVAAEAQNGITAVNATLLIGAAINSYCPQ